MATKTAQKPKEVKKPVIAITACKQVNVDNKTASKPIIKTTKPGAKQLLSKCPCLVNNRNTTQMKCILCKQYWHTTCANINISLSKQLITELEKTWNCPWCFVPLFQQPSNHPSRKNREALMSATISDAIVQSVSESLDTFLNKTPDNITELEKLVNTQSECLKDLTSEIQQLREFQNALLDNKKQKIDPPTQIPDIDSLDINKAISGEKLELSHAEKAVTDQEPAFLDPKLADDLFIFLKTELDQAKFSEANGHSNLLFGEQYKYTGSKAEKPQAIFPAIIKSVVDRIYEKFDGDYELNSVLINHYSAGDTSYLPEHADNESAINPESKIFTLSLGGARKVAFRDIFGPDPKAGDVFGMECQHNSMYTMSRHSQNFFVHRIDPSENAEERFSLTFRCIEQRFRRSTIIIGDSNTGLYKFGSGVGTFGKGLPGVHKYIPTIDIINPSDCLSYNNVVIQCGINHFTKGNIYGPQDVKAVFEQFKTKIDIILRAKRNINIFIVPLLPTRSVFYNKCVNVFNNLIKAKITDVNYKCTILDVELLYDDGGLLCRDYMKFEHDNIHLNKSAVRKIAFIIKQSIYLKYNSGKKRCINSNRSYSDAVRNSNRGDGYSPG